MQGMEKEFAAKPVIVSNEEAYYAPKEQIPITVVEETPLENLTGAITADYTNSTGRTMTSYLCYMCVCI